MYLDVVGALKDKDYDIVGGRYGISSKNTTPNDIYDVFMMLKMNLKTILQLVLSMILRIPIYQDMNITIKMILPNLKYLDLVQMV